MTHEEITSLIKFAKELDRRVTALRLSQAELSRRTALNGAEVISQGYISDILRVGRGDSKKYFRLQRDKVVRLARAVEWSVDEALDFAGFKSAERAHVDTIEEALDNAFFFDQKGLSEADREKIRPLLEVVDREIDRLKESK
jgi:hypothetical protein